MQFINDRIKHSEIAILVLISNLTIVLMIQSLESSLLREINLYSNSIKQTQFGSNSKFYLFYHTQNVDDNQV